MNIILAVIIGCIFYFTDINPVQALEPACPVRLTLEDIKSLRTGSDIPNAQGLHFEAGDGVEDVHTKLPISSRKFEDSVQLKKAHIENDRIICEYTYDKTFGRSGSLTINASTK